MSGSNRLFNLAFRGCLIGITVSLALALPAKSESPKSDANNPEAVGTSVNSPTPQNATQTDPQQGAQSTQDFPLQLPAVEDGGQTEASCGPRCQAAEQREKNDLTAQQTMAADADRMITLTWVQIIAGAVGIGLLLWTLKYTRDSVRTAIRSVEAAESAVKITEKTAKQQLRAYVSIESDADRPPKFDASGFAMWLKAINRGQTPARSCSHWTTVAIEDFPLKTKLRLGKRKNRPLVKIDIGANGWRMIAPKWIGKIGTKDLDALTSGQKRIYILGLFLYRDIFNQCHYTAFRLQVQINEAGQIALISACEKGNKTT